MTVSPLRTDPGTAFAFVPESLQALRQWCVYRTEPKADGKLGKVIVPARAPKGPKARSNAPADWGSVDEACTALRRDPGLVGLVFAMGPGDRLALVDVDGVRDPVSGMLTDEAVALIAPFVGRAYLELSPSGKGLHIIARADGLPEGFTKLTHAPTAFAGPWEVQVASGGHPQFLTVTAHIPDEWLVDELVDCTDEVRALVSELEATKARRAADEVRRAETKATRGAAAPRVASSTAPSDWPDEVILERLRTFPKASRALAGDTGPWEGDHSRADSALAYGLRRAGATEGQAVRLFEASPLYRPDKRPYRLHGTGDVRSYSENLIADAFADPRAAGWETREATAPALLLSSTRPAPAPEAGCCEHAARIADLEATVSVLEREVARLEADRAARVALISATAAVRRNRALPESVRNVAIAAASVIARAGADVDEADGDEGDTGGPLFPVKLPMLADIAGTSSSTASKALKALAATGALRVETRSERVTYPDADGVLREGRALRILIGPPPETKPTEVVKMLATAATAAPETPRNHGGRRLPRPQCPEHPDAGLVITSVTSCAECGEALERRVSRVGVDEAAPVIVLGGHSRNLQESPADPSGRAVSLSSLAREDGRIAGRIPRTPGPVADVDEADEPLEASSHLEIIRNGAEFSNGADPFAHSRAAYLARTAGGQAPPADVDEAPPPSPMQASFLHAAGGGQ